MTKSGWKPLVLSTVVAAAFLPSAAGGEGKSPAGPRKVLVELYSSQGCDSCPPASELLGRLDALGYGPDRVVVLNFHVDYFNDPWVDPYSDPEYSRRQLSYNDVLRRNDLYFTPLMMVDGRYPLLGSNRTNALAALERARKEPPAVTLGLTLSGAGPRQSLAVKLTARTPAVAGRDLLVGVAVTEDPVTTRVESGENAGRSLVEHHVVRWFEHRRVRLDATGAQLLAVPVALPDGRAGARFRVTAFAQDRLTGRVYQAESIPWNPARTREPSALRTSELRRTIEARKARRAGGQRHQDSAGGVAGSSFAPPPDVALVCPACGTPTPVPLASLPELPASINPPRGSRVVLLAGPVC